MKASAGEGRAFIGEKDTYTEHKPVHSLISLSGNLLLSLEALFFNARSVFQFTWSTNISEGGLDEYFPGN